MRLPLKYTHTGTASLDKYNLLSFRGSNQFVYKEISVFKWSPLADLQGENAETYPRDSRADEYSKIVSKPCGNVNLPRAQGESKFEADYYHYPTGYLKHCSGVRLPCFRVKASWPSLVSLTKTSRLLLLRFCLTAQSSSLLLPYFSHFVFISKAGNLQCFIIFISCFFFVCFILSENQTLFFRLTQ